MKETINEMVEAANKDLVRKMASLEEALENRNVKEEQLLTRIEELEAQVEEGKSSRSVSKYNKEYVNDVKTICEAEVNKKLEEALPTAIQKGLRDLPYEMVCAYRWEWLISAPDTTITYDRITMEFNNADRPGGADGKMYLSKLQNVFVQIAKCICLNSKMYLSKF